MGTESYHVHYFIVSVAYHTNTIHLGYKEEGRREGERGEGGEREGERGGGREGREGKVYGCTGP